MTSRTASHAAQRLRAVSRTAYTAAAGHLEVEPESAERERRVLRWAVRPRVAGVAAVLVVVLAGVLGLRLLGGTAPTSEVVAASEAGTASADDPWAAPSETSDADPTSTGDGAGPDAAEEDASEAGAAGDDAEGATSAGVVVHVAGHVLEPGVVELAAGARVYEAIAEAGGAGPDADLAAVNLARVLVDGEQVYVPAPGEQAPAAAAGGGTAAGGAGSPGRVDLNTASVADLDALPGIGPVLAERIVGWREDHGRFTLVDELAEVAGIGPTLLGRLRDLVTV